MFFFAESIPLTAFSVLLGRRTEADGDDWDPSTAAGEALPVPVLGTGDVGESAAAEGADRAP